MRTIASLLLSSVLVTSPLLARAGEPASAQAVPPPRPVAAPSAPAGRADCLPERVLAIDPANDPLHVGTQSYPRTLALGDHEIVLTFDDGPSPATTPSILHALRDACVHATFFLVGRRTRLAPQIARQEYVEGHSVGHHSNSHPSFTLRGFDEASAEADIDNGITADEEAVYGPDASPRNPHVPLFRFPGFADTPALLAYLDGRGIAVFGSDLWAADWQVMTPDQERERVIAALEKRPRHNGIILFHDTRRSTARMLPALLRDLKTRGYSVVHVLYRKGAPTPALTPSQTAIPETVRIIAHLQKPIPVGTHHLGGDDRAF